MLAPTQRFSSRVDNYVRFRPGYPGELVDYLRTECGLTKQAAIADIGSGTGKLTELFLRNGNPVMAVEPNQEMREAGERLLAKFPNFTSVAGTAETTTLPDRSVDFIAAGQAFHWFKPEPTRAEFQRILKPGGPVLLIWNDRRKSTPFLKAYEKLLHEFGTDYKQVNHRNVGPEALLGFFRAEPKLKTFPYAQHFDFEGLKGRLLSSSYVPEAGQPKYDGMLAELRRIFDAHQTGGQVAFEYDSLLYWRSLP
jgi:SAM-dependent methyltransferase